MTMKYSVIYNVFGNYNLFYTLISEICIKPMTN